MTRSCDTCLWSADCTRGVDAAECPNYDPALDPTDAKSRGDEAYKCGYLGKRGGMK